MFFAFRHAAYIYTYSMKNNLSARNVGHVFSHVWLDTLQGSNRTNNRNNSPSPKPLTAAKIVRQEQLKSAAIVLVIFCLISHLTRMLEADLPEVQ